MPLYIVAAFTTAPNVDDPFFFNIFLGHLWFLQFLFLISVIALPLLLFLRSKRGRHFIAKLAEWCGHWGEPFSLKYVIFNAAMSIASWSWVAFVLSQGAKYLNVKSKLVTYGNEAVLPFYIFHQTIILCVGWFVIRWNMSILSKYLIITVISFILIIVLYEMLVRPFDVMRFLFGLRPKKKAAASSTASPQGFGA